MMDRTDFIVDCIVQSFCTNEDQKEKFLLRHALTNLVTMAKAEKTLEIQRDLEFIQELMKRAGPGY